MDQQPRLARLVAVVPDPRRQATQASSHMASGVSRHDRDPMGKTHGPLDHPAGTNWGTTG